MTKLVWRASILASTLVLLLSLVSCITAPVAVPGPEAEKARAAAWQALWGDRFADAEAGFREYLKANPSSAEALRGLGIALFAKGAVFEAGEKLLAAVVAKPDAAASVAVRAFVAGEVPYRDSLDRWLLRADSALARSENAPGTRRMGVRGQLHHAMEAIGDPAATKKLAAKIGVVSGWNLLGPFPSISGAGFDEPFIDESHVAAAVSRDPSTPGLDNRTLKWISPTREEPDGMIHVAERLKGSGGCAYYGTATFSLTADGDYWIIVDRVGALRLWIDGGTVLSDPSDQIGDDLHWVRKHLSKGDHRVIVKVADDTRPAAFRVCLERAVVDPSADTAAARTLALLPGLRADDADPTLARLAIQAGQSGQAEDRFWFAFLLADKGYPRAALAQAAELRRLAGVAGPALARIIESRAFLLLGRDDDAHNALAGARSVGPSFAPTIDLMLAEALGNGRTKELERLLEDSEKSLGRRYRTDVVRVLLAAQKGKDVYTKVAELTKAYADVPEVYELLLSGSVRGYDVSGMLPQLIQKKLPSETRLAFVERLREDGYYSPAYQQAQLIIPIYPSSDSLFAAMLGAGYFSRTRTYAQTVTDLDASLNEFPQSRILLGMGRNLASGYVSNLEGRAGAAPTSQQSDELSKERKRLEGYLAALLEIDPSDFTSRDTIRLLRGEERFNTLVQVTDPFTAIDDYERAAQPVSGDVVRVLDEEVLLCFGDGGRRTLRQLVLKMASRNGASMESTQQVDVDSWRERFTIDRAIVLKPDRTRISAKISGTKLSFPGLEAGDYLVLSYAVDGSQSGSLRGRLWTSMALTSFAFVHRADFRIIYPEAASLKVAYHNETRLEFKETRGSPFPGYQEMRITVAGAKAVGLAPALPDQRDVLAWVDVSTVPDWDFIVRWYRGLSAGRIVPTPLIDETVRVITAGVPNRAAVISRLYDFISNKIDYEDLSFQYSAYVPQKPESVLDDRYGDCKDKCALLIAMLRSAGIDSWIALSDPTYDGENTFLPSPRFNHTIVVVPKAGVGSTDLLLDPTSESFTYPDLPPNLAGTWYLPIPPVSAPEEGSSAGLRRIARSEPETTEILVELDAGAAETTFRASALMRGIHAARLRSILRSADSDIRRTTFALYASSGIPGAQLAEYSASHLDDIYAPPVLEFSGMAPACIVGGNVLVIPWFVAVPVELLNIVRAAPRRTPLEVDEPSLKTPQHQTCVIRLPKGARVAELPADANLRFGPARAVFRFAVKGERVVCEREVYLPPVNVAPADLQAFESFLSAVAAKQRETVRLQTETR
jgi:cellulose synthase operon protein C